MFPYFKSLCVFVKKYLFLHLEMLLYVIAGIIFKASKFLKVLFILEGIVRVGNFCVGNVRGGTIRGKTVRGGKLSGRNCPGGVVREGIYLEPFIQIKRRQQLYPSCSLSELCYITQHSRHHAAVRSLLHNFFYQSASGWNSL